MADIGATASLDSGAIDEPELTATPDEESTVLITPEGGAGGATVVRTKPLLVRSEP